MQTVKMLSTKQFEQWLQEQAEIAVRYRKIEKSDLLAEYNTLKEVVESAEFQAKKTRLTTTRYADTQEGGTMALYNSLKWNTSVILYNLLKKETYKEKAEVAQYLALAEQIIMQRSMPRASFLSFTRAVIFRDFRWRQLRERCCFLQEFFFTQS